MKKIAFLTNALPISGVGHYSSELKKTLKNQGSFEIEEYMFDGPKSSLFKNGQLLKQLYPWPIKTINWIRLGKRFKHLTSAFDALHATNQTLSFVVNQSKPSIVTVHDLIELLDPQQLFSKSVARFLYRGIPKASHLIAVSEYTKKTIQEYYTIPSEKISVIHNGVSNDFYPIPDFKKTADAKIVLYVGSEHPRKNLSTALQAFAEVKKQMPEALFIKVGSAGIKTGRLQTLQQINQLKLESAVRFVESVSQQQLNELYNLADVFIYPSKFEGFGLPPLQAMAAGTPVVTSNSTSLPEIVGEAGIMHELSDTQAFAKTMLDIINNATLQNELRNKGFIQAQKFSWEEAALKTAKVYNSLI